jgi:hypothetical protein
MRRVNSHVLDPERILATIDRLRARIRERFPAANLARIADDLHGIAREHTARSARIQRPSWLLRGLSALLLSAAIAGLVAAFVSLRIQAEDRLPLSEALQALDAGLSSLILLGASAVFLLGLDLRRRRARCLAAPQRELDAFQLSRYLDYCSEMLSLMGKLAALYVQNYPDPQATAAVDDIESLTTGLSHKIWQKIMLLEQTVDPAPEPGR